MRFGVKQSLNLLLRFQPLREFLHSFFLLFLEMESRIEGEYDDQVWKKLEPIYIGVRRRLLQLRMWRYGPLFVWDNARPVFDKLAEHNLSLEGKVYCDLGCGTHHPYGTSAIMYINGAASTIATDLIDTDKKRAAEALYELLQDCLANPDVWHWSDLSRGEYLDRVQSFNFKALRVGDLEAGIGSAPLRHIIASIYETAIEPDSIDIMSSRSVLEHLLDFEEACNRLFVLMSPSGVAYHLIDLVDHRAYGSPKHHWWSFLAEDEHWSDDLCNRLRASEISEFFERTGFEILSYNAIAKAEMPGGFRKQLKGQFASMSNEELELIRIACLIKKPQERSVLPAPKI
jgi:hypothetical protein